jgi:predicted nucleotide-binding protein
MLEVSAPIAHELLAQCVKQGHALVQRATLVGDFSDYEAWKSARKQWIDPTVHALEHMYDGPREAREFADAVECPEASDRWQEQYAADLECVKSAIEVLTVLQGELAFDAGTAGAGALALEAESSSAGELPPEPLAPEAIVPEAITAAPSASAAEGERTPELGLRERELDDEQHPTEAGGPRVDLNGGAVGAELTRAAAHGSELAQHEEATPIEHAEASAPAHAQARRVYLAYGRDERWKEAVAHLLERAGSHEVTILAEDRQARAALSEHRGEQASGSRYAIVLLTADDIGAQRLESTEEPFFSTRPRLGVVFEMGFLVAALSPGRVCVLYEDGVELPCELDGIAHVRLDLAGTWQPKLLLALRRAGFDYDLNRLAA